MSESSWVETLVTAQVAGPNLTASLTATSLLPTHAKIQLPSGHFGKIGKALRIKGWGLISNIVTTPGTFTLDVRLNSTPIVVWNGGAIQLGATAHTTVPFEFEATLVTRSIGAGTSATLAGSGHAISQAIVVTAGTADPANPVPNTLFLPNTSGVVGTGFDSTASNLLDLYGTFSLNNANAFQLQGYTVESLN